MFLKKFFKVVPEEPLTRGLDLFNDARYGEALDVFEGLILDPDEKVQEKARLYSCEAHLQLGDASASRDLQAAVYHYRKAVDYQPRFADIHNKVGEMSRRLGRLEEAADAFRRSLAINEHYFMAHLNLVQTLLEMGQLTQCGAEIRVLRATCPPLFRELAEELVLGCENGDRQRMTELLAEIRHLDPDAVSLARERALQVLRHGEPERAAEMLEVLVEKHPRFPDLRHILGLAYGDMGLIEEAMACFRQALELNPHYLKARINLGFTLMELERYDEARQELESALTVDPEHPLAKSALKELSNMGISSRG
jgi:tetratricopeptide (TPR) repeat protein